MVKVSKFEEYEFRFSIKQSFIEYQIMYDGNCLESYNSPISSLENIKESFVNCVLSLNAKTGMKQHTKTRKFNTFMLETFQAIKEKWS